MKRFTTYTQRKILQFYWDNHTPFTVSSLIENGTAHFHFLCKLTLRLMESRGQVLAWGKWDSKPMYIATTESKDEWKSIWERDIPYVYKQCCFRLSLRGMNWYENEELIADLEEIIEDYRQNPDSV